MAVYWKTGQPIAWFVLEADDGSDVGRERPGPETALRLHQQIQKTLKRLRSPRSLRTKLRIVIGYLRCATDVPPVDSSCSVFQFPCDEIAISKILPFCSIVSE
jgi:hypothetical protein